MVFAPSSERWRLVVTLFGRGVCCCLATGLPLGCEVVFERGVRYSYCCNKSSSVEVLSVGDSGLEILLGEGGDVELGARTSQHIFMFAFDPLSLNSLSLLCALHLYSYCHIIFSLCCALHLFHIAISYYMLGLFVCASLVLNQRELHIAPQPISRGIKRSYLNGEFGYTRWLY